MAGHPGSESSKVEDLIVIEHTSASLVPSGSAVNDISDELHKKSPFCCEFSATSQSTKGTGKMQEGISVLRAQIPDLDSPVTSHRDVSVDGHDLLVTRVMISAHAQHFSSHTGQGVKLFEC
jgi:hypothetical protein